jgi:hypothetical protein
MLDYPFFSSFAGPKNPFCIVWWGLLWTLGLGFICHTVIEHNGYLYSFGLGAVKKNLLNICRNFFNSIDFENKF